VYALQYSQKKNKTTPIGVVVTSVEEEIFTTLEELAQDVEKEEALLSLKRRRMQPLTL